MSFDVAGRRVVVTGASSGIGAALAEGFAAAGATVGMCARRTDRLDDVLARCRAHAPESQRWTVDLADMNAVDRFADDVVETMGEIDVLVNNAGIPLRRNVVDLADADVVRAMTVNYFSPVRLTLALLPHLRSRPAARVVNISSVAAVLSSPGEAAYDASKAALTAFSEAMAIDLWDSPVSVLTVYPGLIATDLIDAPGNEPIVGDVEPVAIDEVVTAVLAALAADSVQVFVPNWFADIAAGKAANVGGFLAGAADYVKATKSPPDSTTRIDQPRSR